MVKKTQVGGEFIPYLGTHKGGTAVALSGSAVEVTIPSDANWAWLSPEGGAVYYGVNEGTASASSPGYCAEDQHLPLWPVDNFGTLHVFGSAGTVHVQFFQD